MKESQSKRDPKGSSLSIWTESKNYSKTKANSTRQVKNGRWSEEAAHGTHGWRAFYVVYEHKPVGRISVVKVTLLIWIKRI